MNDPHKVPDIPMNRDEAGNYPEDYHKAGEKQDPPPDNSFLDTPPPELPPIPENSDI